MLKIFGALLVLAGSGWWGMSAVAGLRRRVRALEQLRACLVGMGEELSFHLTPIPTLLERMAREQSGPVGRFFQDALAGLRRDPEGGVRQSWRQAMVRQLDFLKEEERQALMEVGQALGRYDAKAQGQVLAQGAARLERIHAQAAEEAHRLGRVYAALSLALGAAVVLLLA